MSTTPSLLSRTEMIISLKTIQYLLETCRPLLSDYERELVKDFVISLAGSMVIQTRDRITISVCSTSEDAITELHEQIELYAVIDAAYSKTPGAKGSSSSAPLKETQPPTSQATSTKNIQKKTTRKGDTPISLECHSNPALEPE